MVNIMNLLDRFINQLEMIIGIGSFCNMKSSPAALPMMDLAITK